MLLSTDSGRACVHGILRSHLFCLLFRLCGSFAVVVFFAAKGFPSTLSCCLFTDRNGCHAFCDRWYWEFSIYTYRYHEQSHLLDL